MQQVTVIGSGTMGSGIAHSCAQHGFSVALVDIHTEALTRAAATISKNLDRQVQKEIITEQEKADILTRIKHFTVLQEAVGQADLVIEAATENEAVKTQLFKELDMYCPPNTILASNTSSISITQLAAATQRPDRVIGMHFMNPVHIMSLVEVIRGYATNDITAQTILNCVQRLDKTPIIVQDYPGFIANRILMPMINEAIYALYEGVAGVVEIDTVMKLGMAHPMGPLQLADFIGLDVCLSILQVLHQGFGRSKYAPCPLLANMVLAKQWGVKSGTGFYQYGKDKQMQSVAFRFQLK